MLSNPTPPAIHVFPSDPFTDYDKAMAVIDTMGTRHGTDKLFFTIQGFVAFMNDTASQQLLDRMLEPSGGVSVKEAVELDGSLGGLVDDCSITSVSGYKQYVMEDQRVFLGAEWVVEVLAG